MPSFTPRLTHSLLSQCCNIFQIECYCSLDIYNYYVGPPLTHYITAMDKPDTAGSSSTSQDLRYLLNPFNQDSKPCSKFVAPTTPYTFPTPIFKFPWTEQPQSTAEFFSTPESQPRIRTGLPPANYPAFPPIPTGSLRGFPFVQRIKVGSPETYTGDTKPPPEFR